MRLRDFSVGWIVGLELIVRFKKHLENIDFMGKEHIRNAPFLLDTLWIQILLINYITERIII